MEIHDCWWAPQKMACCFSMGRRPWQTRRWPVSKASPCAQSRELAMARFGWRLAEAFTFALEIITVAAAASGNDARALAVIPNANSNEVWCATAGAGLLKATIDKDVGPIVSQLDSEQGLPSQNAFAVLPQADGGPGVNRYESRSREVWARTYGPYAFRHAHNR